VDNISTLGVPSGSPWQDAADEGTNMAFHVYLMLSERM
jgi:hypothetical protein